MPRFLQVFYAVFSGTLIALAIPNELFNSGSPLAGIISLVPLYIAFSRSKSYKEAFWLCWIHGAVTHLLSSFWLGNFQGFAIFTLGASDIGTGFLEAFVSLIMFYPFALSSGTLSQKRFFIPLRVFWFSGIYAVYEWCKSVGFLAYPWGTLSMTACKWRFITQIADITGTYGITILFALFSAVIGETFCSFTRGKKTSSEKRNLSDCADCAKAVFALAAVSVAYGIYQCAVPRIPVKTLNAILVQQNMDPWEGGDAQSIEISKQITKEKAAEFKALSVQPDLVVWSEGILSKKFPAAQSYYEHFPESEPLMKFIKDTKIPFVIGGSVTINSEEHKNGNAAILIDKNGKFKGSYIKLHLVPFAESIPGSQYAFVRAIVKKIAGFSYGWTQGSKYVLFEIPLNTKTPPSGTQIISLLPQNAQTNPQTALISVPICFDDAFGEVCRGLFLNGSEVFVNITNDAWSETRSAEYQHFAVASYRAIEYRTTLVRCTNSGYTVITDPAGKILQDLPLFVQAGLAAKIPVYRSRMTTYALLGNWLPVSIMILAAAFIILQTHTQRKHKPPRPPTEPADDCQTKADEFSD